MTVCSNTLYVVCMNTLLEEVEAFIVANGVSATRFGDEALGDRHFVRQLRDGRDVKLSTVDKVRNFMRDWREPEAAPASAAA